MATAGSAVGLGSLWRFPYIAGDNGGGAFVFLYILFTFLIGFPIFIAELLMGRKTQLSSIESYTELAGPSSNWRILGWLNFLTCLIILSYYSVVSGWCLSYTLMSLTQFWIGKSTEEIKHVFDVLFTSPSINLFWFAIFLVMNVGIILGGVRKGVEHWSKILMPILFTILIALFLYAITMPGFLPALSFIFVPDFSKLSASGVLNALGMACFTLSVGLGILITYGSYMQKKEDIPSNGAIVALMTVFVALISALTIFPIVFTFGFPPEMGPGLVFQTLPVLFAKLPASILISTVFFALLLFAALTSTISILEMLVANMIDLFNFTRRKATLIAALLTFIIGIPSALSGSDLLFPDWTAIYGKNFFDTMNYITASWFMPIAALFATLFVGYRMKKEVVFEEFLSGTKARFLLRPWFFAVRYIAPIAIILIILQQTGLIHF